MKLSATLLSLALVAGVASANNKDKADALFKQGKKLMSEKRYADACEAFEKSNKLDPGIGTQLNIAKCYEEWGKIGRAFLAYQEAEAMAKAAKDSREPKIHELVEGLDSQAPRLTIKLPKDTSTNGLTVTLDGDKVTKFGEPFVIDPGPHTIEYSISGGAKKDRVVPVERGGDSEVTLDIPKGGKPDVIAVVRHDVKADTKPDTKQEVQPPPPGRNMRLGGIVIGGAGVIAIGVSSIMTLSARGKYNDALDAHCGGMKTTCDDEGLTLTHDARSTANTATVIFIAGTAAVAGGVLLYLFAPHGDAAESEEKSARYIVPAVSPDGAGVVFGGNF
ncbi:MAG: tetratricopeptide repeat protein [Kofleriaceae bacterium]|nr:tetratricopeptide repeat protein [Kofleriaceae bacterium]